MKRSIFQAVGRRLYYSWINHDLNQHLKQIETMSFKRHIEEQQTRVESGETAEMYREFGPCEKGPKRPVFVSPATVTEYMQEIWNYGTFLVIHSFEAGHAREMNDNMKSEAAQIVNEMTAVFKKHWYPGCKQLPIDSFMPKPSITYVAPEFKIIPDDAVNDISADEDIVGQEIRTQFGETMENKLQEVLSQLKDGISHEIIVNSLLNDEDVTAYVKKALNSHFNKSRTLSVKPSSIHYLVILSDLIQQAVTDIREFSRTYDIEFLKDGEVRCFYNLLNLYIHHLSLHTSLYMSKTTRELYFAASALHPLQDDYADEYGIDQPVQEAVETKLNGGDPGFVNEEANKIIAMIDVIYRVYPVEKHQKLNTIFNELHRWQLHSEKQANSYLSDDELLEVSFMKGGYAFALFGYIANGRMTMKQFNHFFYMGAIFQLLDDFHDLEDDLMNETTTVWTRSYHRGEWSDGTMNGIIALQQDYEKNSTTVDDFKNPVLMRRIETIGIRYDVFRFYTMIHQFFSQDYQAEFEACFPFSLDMPRQFFSQTRTYETLDYINDTLHHLRKMM